MLQIMFNFIIINSPPHRWLRNESSTMLGRISHSPPHRWLRNFSVAHGVYGTNSPPHRWLRKNAKQISII
ncbi:hypothetical protein BAZOLSSOX_2266 [uncultured Gammaproteobacteria bacterium]|nr:hypothetical protein BAZOLSSOX_2266 [uncultured Gammaproteobacteria bacterium]